MSNFSDYSESFVLKFHSNMLDYAFDKTGYTLFEGSTPLFTPGGNAITHTFESVIRTIATDIQLAPVSGQSKLVSPLLFSYMKDVIEAGDDPMIQNWAGYSDSDPFVLIKTRSKVQVQPFKPEEPLFEFSFLELTGLTWQVNQFVGRLMSEINLEDTDTSLFPGILKLYYSQLTAGQKTAIQALGKLHNAGIVLPMLLASGEISPVEYSKGLIALQLQTAESYTGILSEASGILAFMDLLMQKQVQGINASLMIKEGESDSIEFKSTLRWDIRAGKTNAVIERSSLKTISAFLNSSGGTLMVGVRDDGSVEGIETDKFVNEDKFLLHLWTLIRLSLGREFTPYIRTRLEKMDEKTVCIVTCLPANRPVFLRQAGFDEEMFIRVGPSSNALNISEALTYIADRFTR